MKKLDLILEYLYNKHIFLENDYIQLLNNTAYRTSTSYDLFKRIEAITRIELFSEITSDIYGILHSQTS